MRRLDRWRAHRLAPLLVALAALAGLGAWVGGHGPFQREWPVLALSVDLDQAALFRPYTVGRPIAGAWRLEAAVHHVHALELQLSDGGAWASVYLTLPQYARGLGGTARPWGEVAPGVPPTRDREGFSKAVDLLVHAFETNWTRPLFFSGPDQEARSNLPDGVYQGLFLLLLALLAGLGLRALRRWGIGLAPELLGGVLVLGAGALFRWLASPHAPLHAGHHGINELDGLLAPLLGPTPTTLFFCQEAILDLLFGVTGRSATALWAWNALAGAALALAGGKATRELTGRRTAGWLAALFLAFSPLLARVAMSESAFLWVGLFLALALAGLARYVRTLEAPWLGVGLTATVLLTHAHGTTPVFAALPLVAMVLARGEARWRARAGLALAFAAVAILLVPHVAFLRSLAPVMGSELGSKLPEYARLVFTPTFEQHLFFNAATSPSALAALAVLGFVLAWLRRPRLGLFVTLALPLFAVVFNNTQCFTALQRYQSPLVLVLTMLAGGGAGALVLLTRRRWVRGVTAAALVGWTVATLPGPLAANLTPDTEARAYLFLVRQAERLPQHGVLARLPSMHGRFYFPSGVPGSLFPNHGKVWRVVDATPEGLRSVGGAGSALYAYRGLTSLWAAAYLANPPGTFDPNDPAIQRFHALLGENLRAFDWLVQEKGLVRLEAEPVRSVYASGAFHDFYALPAEPGEIELFGPRG